MGKLTFVHRLNAGCENLSKCWLWQHWADENSSFQLEFYSELGDHNGSHRMPNNNHLLWRDANVFNDSLDILGN